MGSRSSSLLLILSFGVIFLLIYLNYALLPRPLHQDPSVVRTEPRITQQQALEVAAQALKEQLPDLKEEEIMLWFTQYNYTEGSYEARPERFVGYQWPLPTVRQNPELLSLQLAFFHQNGTIYYIDGSNIRECESCGATSDLRRGYLAWRIDSLPYVVDVDAETGKLLWPRFVADKFPVYVPIHENITEAKTVRELAQNPSITTEVTILPGSGDNDTGKPGVTYQPTEARGINEISNKVAWTNEDVVAHTVTSDSIYPIERGTQFNSGAIQPGGTYEYIFDREGEYPYHCLIHPWMKGSVEIVPNFA